MAFRLITTSRFERDVRQHLRRHSPVVAVLEDIRTILTNDPQNLTREHDIKKLGGVRLGSSYEKYCKMPLKLPVCRQQGQRLTSHRQFELSRAKPNKFSRPSVSNLGKIGRGSS